MIEFRIFGPLLASAGFLLAMIAIFGRESKSCRALAAALCILLTVRFLGWHAMLAMPKGQSPLQQIWVWTFFLFEFMANLGTNFSYFFMSRTRNRSADADVPQNSPLLAAPVDVFIATYNESAAIVERTIVGAMAIDHPDLRVFVLDDGARDVIRDLAEDLGAHYVYRMNGKHAKAGNVNNGLRHALETGRRPEFILLLDADFVPSPNILKRTLGLFAEPDVGIVQTPQHFYSPDPIQTNLVCSSVWPDEQRFFFEILEPAKDAWGAAFCVGTSAVIRVEALLAINGMATETVTEDLLTTFKMQEQGYRTIYLNERLSMGLAAEGLHAFITQRSRWCLGTIQQLFTRWSFFGPARIGLMNRFSYFDGLVYWIFSFPFKILLMTAPLVFWWTGTGVIESDVAGLIEWLFPSIVCGIIFMSVYGGNRILPVMSGVSQLVPSFAVIQTAIIGLLRPFGWPFNVTPKGLRSGAVTVHWNYLLPFALAAVGTFLGLLVNVSAYSNLNGMQGYDVNIFWSFYSIGILILAAAVCIELPQRRQHVRFPVNQQAVLVGRGQAQGICTIGDLSLGGAIISSPPPVWAKDGEGGTLLLDQGAFRVPFRFRLDRSRNPCQDFAIEFEAARPLRRRLMAKLFGGAYRGTTDRIDVGSVAFAITKRLLR